MFEGFIYIFECLFGLILGIPGIILIIYGLYSVTIVGFDKTFRIFCLSLGVLLLSIVTYGYLNIMNEDVNNREFIGVYKSNTLNKQLITLKENGDFIGNTQLGVLSRGTWKVISFDEFYYLEFYNLNNEKIDQVSIFKENSVLRLTFRNFKIEDAKEFNITKIKNQTENN